MSVSSGRGLVSEHPAGTAVVLSYLSLSAQRGDRPILGTKYSIAGERSGPSGGIPLNVSNLRDTGHSPEPAPPAAMAELFASAIWQSSERTGRSNDGLAVLATVSSWPIARLENGARKRPHGVTVRPSRTEGTFRSAPRFQARHLLRFPGIGRCSPICHVRAETEPLADSSFAYRSVLP